MRANGEQRIDVALRNLGTVEKLCPRKRSALVSSTGEIYYWVLDAEKESKLNHLGDRLVRGDPRNIRSDNVHRTHCLLTSC